MEPTKAEILCVYMLIILNMGSAEPLVNTSSGTLQGTTVLFEGVAVDIYKGVRYAEAPVGELRFSKPVPYAYREGVYNATEFGPSCVQRMSEYPDGFLPNKEISEDCLMLNIYVPETATTDNKLAVIIWIHGGNFISGQGMFYDGTPMTVYGDVIVVTINYRLGLFAMISTGDEHARGNYGLFDQQLAFRWVKENIGQFYGDVDRITIAGESAGGASVLYHVISPSSEGLFQRGVIQSVPFVYSIDDVKSVEASITIASLLNCSEYTDISLNRNSKEILDCLRAASSDMLLQFDNLVFAELTGHPLFTIDGEFFQGSLESMIAHSNLDRYDLVIGTVDQEGLVYLDEAIENNTTVGISRQHFEYLASQIAGIYPSNHDDIAKAIIYRYSDWTYTDNDYIRLTQILGAFGDSTFYAPTVDFAKVYSRKDAKPMFYYNFSPQVPYPLVPWLTQTAGHADELMYLWSAVNQTTFVPPLPTRDVQLSRTMMTYWTNFVKTGNPNNGGSTSDMITWPRFTNNQQEYLELTYNLEVKTHPKAAERAFWKEYLADLGKPENSCQAAMVPQIQPMNSDIAMETRPSVETTYGKVTGFTVKSHDAVGGKNVDVFLGIPYAKPPTGNRRFRAPQTTNSWTDLNVTRYASACPQPGRLNTSEDCLYLNIFAPMRDNNELLPVMVIIHGDSFTTGDSSDHSGDVIAAYGDVIVVTLNYRLGILGFLSTENATLPGNYALHDILFALQWIRGDVTNFGGNPDQVTLAGFKAGAVITQLLMTSPLSRDLFHRVICLSGTLHNYLGGNTNNSPLAAAEHLIKRIGCSRDNLKRTLGCLRSVNMAAIIDMTSAVETSFPHRPVVDGEVLVQDPSELMTTGDYNPLDMMLGTTNSELAPSVLAEGTANPSIYNENVNSLVSSHFHGNADVLTAAIFRQYPSISDDDLALTSQLLDMTNDFWIYAPTVKTAKMHSSAGGEVYVYRFTQRLSHSMLPPWVGATQGDDLKLILGEPFVTSQDSETMSFNNQERQLSLNMMKYVTNFVKTGNPNTGSDVPIEWPLFTMEESNYLELDICPEILTSLREEQVTFWNNYMIALEETTIPSTDDETVYIGDGLGMRMSANEAETLIKALAGVIIALVILIIVVIVGFCGYTQSLLLRNKMYQRGGSRNGFYSGATYINEDTNSTIF